MTDSIGRRVLVVEDDAKIAQLLVDYLRRDGFDASAVADGHVALRQVQQSVPSLLILDLMLPGLDGIEICRAVRRFSDVPIMMVTARVDEIDRLLGLETGADDYVCKPFSPSEVVARVRAMLRRAEGRVDVLAQALEHRRGRLSHQLAGQAAATDPGRVPDAAPAA